METKCPFCTLPEQRIWFGTENAVAILDGFPITEGHTLVIPHRHVASVFDLPEEEFREVWSVVDQVRKLLKKKYRPDAFNIGVNDGAAAGQTIAHAYIHVIPRRKGDIQDPRGGVRWIFPNKAKYW
jgi:diadenosine tetraphosphate (Ap4A) HIT family hydrolase